MKRIIQSLLDNDLYKFTMMMAVAKLFPRKRVRYQFFNRKDTVFPEGFADKLRKQVRMMEELQLNEDQRSFLERKLPFLTPVFLDILQGYRFDASEVGITQKGGQLTIEISGLWYRTILWEVPLLSMVSELYFQETGEEIWGRNQRKKNNQEKAKTFYGHNMKVADFSTRRRYSFDNQFEMVKDMLEIFGSHKFLVGTSNVHIAHLLDLTPIGTHAHEWVSGIAALEGYAHANKHMMDHWVDVYEGSLGIALTDTFGLDAFLKDFTVKYAKLFDGVRHDSGDPFVFGDRIIEHYEKLGIDPMSKTIVFSDGLTTEKALEIHNYFRGRIKVSFGIGTHLGNDVGVDPLSIVIKLIEIDGNHVIKLSDTAGKHTGDGQTIDMVKFMVNYSPLPEREVEAA